MLLEVKTIASRAVVAAVVAAGIGRSKSRLFPQKNFSRTMQFHREVFTTSLMLTFVPNVIIEYHLRHF
jgi:hypothetical protein